MYASNFELNGLTSTDFSNALIEAMASGLPVVASEVGGNREAVGDAGGRIVPPEDEDALARAILELAADPAGRRALAARAHERAARLFTRDRMVGQTDAVYQSLLGPENRRATAERGAAA